MVLLDSSSPRQLTDVADYSWQYQLMRRGFALLPSLARVGLGSPQAARNGRDEVSMIPTLFEQAQALTTLGDRPLAVLTASGSLTTGGWAEAQDRLAALSTNSVHREAESSHSGLLEEAHGAAASVAAVETVLTALAS
jgi:hypothetical protein